MRIFICYDDSGNIVSTMKVNVMDKELDHPYGLLEEGESVIEVEPTSDLEELECHEISERFVVDTDAKKLKKRTE